MRKLYVFERTHNLALPPGAARRRAASASAIHWLLSLSTIPPSPVEVHDGDDDGQDLGELLHSRGFDHWRSLLESLMARYAGWLTHYWLDDRFDLDVWPQADVIKVLVEFPAAATGNDQGFALALSRCDFLARVAVVESTGQPWDALTQAYVDFLREHPDAEPSWSYEPPWSAEDFAAWALAQLPPQR